MADRVPMSGARIALAVLLGVLSLACLAILVDVQLNDPGQLWFEGISDETTKKGMSILGAAGFLEALVAMLLVLLIRPRRDTVA